MAIIKETNINVSTDIGQVLNEAGGSVNVNQPLTYFTTAAKHCKWSKYKPSNTSENFIANLTDTINVQSPIQAGIISVPWYLGDIKQIPQTNYNFYEIGRIKVPFVHSVSNSEVVNLINNYPNNGANWELADVRDDVPKRLGDFRKYSTSEISPFYHSVTPVVYNGESVFFTMQDNAENETQLSMEDISLVLNDTFERGVIVKSSSGSLTYYGSGEDVTNGGIGANWGTRLSAGAYTVYFVARSNALEITIPYPSTTDYPNPATFVVMNTNNPNTNPFNNLIRDVYGEGGFAYDNTSTYFEPMYNVNESDYTTLCTTGSYCVRIDYTATEDTSVNFGNVSFNWMFTGTRGDGKPSFRPIINNVNYANSTYTFKKGVKTSVYYQIDDIFYDYNSGTRYQPQQDESFNLDQLVMNYNGISEEYIDLDITYDQYHNGYFYNSTDGYYRNK